MQEPMLPIEWTQIEIKTNFSVKSEESKDVGQTVITEVYDNPLQPKLF